MSWLPTKTRKKTDERIKNVQKSSVEAKESYDRMLRSLKDLEEILDVKPKRGPDTDSK